MYIQYAQMMAICERNNNINGNGNGNDGTTKNRMHNNSKTNNKLTNKYKIAYVSFANALYRVCAA